MTELEALTVMGATCAAFVVLMVVVTAWAITWRPAERGQDGGEVPAREDS